MGCYRPASLSRESGQRVCRGTAVTEHGATGQTARRFFWLLVRGGAMVMVFGRGRLLRPPLLVHGGCCATCSPGPRPPADFFTAGALGSMLPRSPPSSACPCGP